MLGVRGSISGLAILVAAAAAACTFESTGHGGGNADIDPTGSSSADSTAAHDGSSGTGSDGGGQTVGMSGSTSPPGDDGADDAPPGDTGDPVGGSSSTGGGVDPTDPMGDGSSGGETGEPPTSDGYHACSKAEDCGISGELCLHADQYYVCSYPCETPVDCPTAPGGTAPPNCYAVGQPTMMCFLDCTQGMCPGGMVCNPNGHCSFQ